MKKFAILFLLLTFFIAPIAFAQAPPSAAMSEKADMKVYACSMDGYTAEKSGKCPMCGMKLEKKIMKTDEAQSALEKSKEMVKQ